MNVTAKYLWKLFDKIKSGDWMGIFLKAIFSIQLNIVDSAILHVRIPQIIADEQMFVSSDGAAYYRRLLPEYSRYYRLPDITTVSMLETLERRRNSTTTER